MNLSKDTFPIKTLNGSSFEHMAKDVQEVVSALEKAQEELAAASPHPRDYQIGQMEYTTVRQQHKEHQKVLSDLLDFYVAKRNHCLDRMGRK